MAVALKVELHFPGITAFGLVRVLDRLKLKILSITSDARLLHCSYESMTMAANLEYARTLGAFTLFTGGGRLIGHGRTSLNQVPTNRTPICRTHSHIVVILRCCLTRFLVLSGKSASTPGALRDAL